TCHACNMYCGIDRFEIAGRHFPFGGRCSLFEHAWKRGTRTAVVPDLVEQRAAILFRAPSVAPPELHAASAELSPWDFGPKLAEAKAFLGNHFGRETPAI